MLIEVFYDVLCPWCYIGKHRLRRVLTDFPGRDEVRLRWRSYQLSPDEGRIPGPTAAEAMATWTAPDQLPVRLALIEQLGTDLGLAIDLDKARPVNTFDAHRLTHFAADHERADALVEALLRAYQAEGRNVADHLVLLELAHEVGLPEEETGAVLAGDRYADAVIADQRRAAELRVSGVPTLVVDGGRPFSGMQPPEMVRAELDRAAAASRALLHRRSPLSHGRRPVMIE
ncbi:putative dithiol-disulfide isomerase involved in polyketide biosynthesis [Frankia casuarinae]|uniref:DSBA oxidoreductase n=1 Tax=Frankia casuarinae (strain DSM 45818 / CECT 9043 / HFP020203 / CcI3) TaxID=106370 RepID=Q2J5I8_FRACC|nr:DsbA family oxidoreductase [Frankia casuarinae]ABD13454.1 DSBA oxidoreductase [Frankia casuarinae]EYT90522.1 putative dithiol-disulfide isomerase involved in polyketide biosynthesis [Frankia casuarinae]